jgi:hypothetical protein
MLTPRPNSPNARGSEQGLGRVSYVPAWLTSKVCHVKDLANQKLGKKNYHRFDMPNVRVWQVLVANQILVKIMSCQIFNVANFGTESTSHIFFGSVFRLYFISSQFTELLSRSRCLSIIW